MERRRLRLGDILDDYCPRERRVTNHAVVAMIDEDIKQTRCTTCDAEHAYKGGRLPKRRTKPTSAALTKEVLVAMPETGSAPTLTEQPPATDAMQESDVTEERADEDSTVLVKDDMENDTAEPTSTPVEDGPVHRPLIRATLPRPEGQKDLRPAPEFTIRQPGTRGNGNFRGGRMRGQGNGGRPQGGGRFSGARPGLPRRGPSGRGGQPAGFRSGQPRHGGKKRSR